jgi:heme-degrading monooxygenase HmoA
MHARLSRFAGLPPERIDETLRQFEEEQLPVLERQSGYRGVMVMVNRGTGQAAAITLWETQDDLRESAKVADRVRAAAVKTAQPSREPVVDSYEILVIRQLKGPRAG